MSKGLTITGTQPAISTKLDVESVRSSQQWMGTGRLRMVALPVSAVATNVGELDFELHLQLSDLPAAKAKLEACYAATKKP